MPALWDGSNRVRESDWNERVSKVKRLTILISGDGSNLEALIEACGTNRLQAEVGLVISSKAAVFGLERARRHGIPSQVLSWSKHRACGGSRSTYDQQLARCVAASHPDLIVLAGWMRILTRSFLDRFPGKVVNLHPALPGAFPGLHAIERAFAAWREGTIRETGAMVHWVPDEGVDTGPVIRVVRVPLREGETLEGLTKRMHAAEHGLLVQAIAAALAGEAESLGPSTAKARVHH